MPAHYRNREVLSIFGPKSREVVFLNVALKTKRAEWGVCLIRPGVCLVKLARGYASIPERSIGQGPEAQTMRPGFFFCAASTCGGEQGPSAQTVCIRPPRWECSVTLLSLRKTVIPLLPPVKRITRRGKVVTSLRSLALRAGRGTEPGPRGSGTAGHYHRPQVQYLRRKRRSRPHSENLVS